MKVGAKLANILCDLLWRNREQAAGQKFLALPVQYCVTNIPYSMHSTRPDRTLTNNHIITNKGTQSIGAVRS